MRHLLFFDLFETWGFWGEKQLNSQLQERVEFLQKRERELLQNLMKTQNKGKK